MTHPSLIGAYLGTRMCYAGSSSKLRSVGAARATAVTAIHAIASTMKVRSIPKPAMSVERKNVPAGATTR